MRIILLCVLVSVISADIPPSNTYGAPNGGFSNGFGFGASNGASNGFGAPSNGYSAPSNTYGLPNGGYGVDPEIAALAENIPGGGVPGEDYPILASVPDTGFSCDAQAVQGYYADTAAEAGCQVFHICQDRALRRQQDSFLCPNGTIFNQQYLVCDWWFNVDCSQAESFYSVNELIGVVPDAGYAYAAATNGILNGNGNGYGANGNGANGNGRNGANGYASNGNGKNGNGATNGNGYRSNGNGNGANGNGRNGYAANGNGNGVSNGNGRNGYAANGNGNGVSNGNGRNGYASNGNGANGVNGNGFNGNGYRSNGNGNGRNGNGNGNRYNGNGRNGNGNGNSTIGNSSNKWKWKKLMETDTTQLLLKWQRKWQWFSMAPKRQIGRSGFNGNRIQQQCFNWQRKRQRKLPHRRATYALLSKNGLSSLLNCSTVKPITAAAKCSGLGLWWTVEVLQDIGSSPNRRSENGNHRSRPPHKALQKAVGPCEKSDRFLPYNRSCSKKQRRMYAKEKDNSRVHIAMSYDTDPQLQRKQGLDSNR
ncbi:pro-resilin-like [Penaeus chinensis]|uniref:pro-resilin-like n=1 Tax=Penaeus chinensis TaxID=139456 RepID=UPI001FB69D50|nr:pro-resilin-like [Penaeus chinensis]